MVTCCHCWLVWAHFLCCLGWCEAVFGLKEIRLLGSSLQWSSLCLALSQRVKQSPGLTCLG